MKKRAWKNAVTRKGTESLFRWKIYRTVIESEIELVYPIWKKSKSGLINKGFRTVRDFAEYTSKKDIKEEAVSWWENGNPSIRGIKMAVDSMWEESGKNLLFVDSAMKALLLSSSVDLHKDQPIPKQMESVSVVFEDGSSCLYQYIDGTEKMRRKLLHEYLANLRKAGVYIPIYAVDIDTENGPWVVKSPTLFVVFYRPNHVTSGFLYGNMDGIFAKESSAQIDTGMFYNVLDELDEEANREEPDRDDECIKKGNELRSFWTKTCLLWSCMPNLFHEGPPIEVLRRDHKEYRNTVHLRAPESVRTTAPHLRRGHFRRLEHERYHRDEQGNTRIVFVCPCLVGIHSEDVETLEDYTIERIAPTP